MPMKVHITTYGCQMNKLDSELVMEQLLAAGFEESRSEEGADVILYNTCSVRAHAENRVYSNVGKLKFLKKRRPHIVIGIIGCMAKSERDRLFRRLPHLDFAAGPGEFGNLAEIITQATGKPEHALAVEDGRFRYSRSVNRSPKPFQAFVSIMRGCDNFCSYCVVPFTRGREYSRPPAEILNEAKRLVDTGVVEITLLGQNVNSYGKGLDEKTSLARLLEKFDSIPDLRRLRFVTNHPKDFSDDLIEAVAALPSVCEYVHLPAQSGSDRVLKAMNRKYTRAEYEEILRKTREAAPDVEFSSDFIVGFPGETEEDFLATADLVKNAEFLNTFVFKYSPRPRTKAARLDDDVPDQVKRERNNLLLDLQKSVQKRRNRAMKNEIVEVLVEGTSPRDERRLIGRTRNNRIAVFPGDSNLAGSLVNMKIKNSTHLTLFGEITDERA